MNLIQASISRPIAVIAAVIMVLLFGWVALQRIPIQMAPDVRQPVVNVNTSWPGAAPAEVEREIINRQEEVFKGLEGLQGINSTARTGRGSISLEFAPGQNMDRALLLIANRLDRVSGYPEEADEPTLSTSGSEDNAIAWFVISRAAGNTTPIHTYGDVVEDLIRDRIERVDGVAGVNVFGGTEREMRIEIDPSRLAGFAMTVGEVVDRLRRANASISGGDVDEGKRRYIVRTEGDFTSAESVKAIVLRSDGSATGVDRVTVGDVADVYLDFKKPGANIRYLGNEAIMLNATREQGANVIETMAGIRATVDELAAVPLPRAGLNIRQVYDETIYINSAIDLVRQNIVVGGILAVIVLLAFLRSSRATVVIALSIPVSVVGSFVAMAALGRSLNVISLAGIAFAVGMVVDAAIVVLENIYRLRQEGLSRADAAYQGAAQVWGAILVSSLTTVMVFIPILVMKLEVGQLFRDIAVAISVSVLLSLLVAVTLIPALANRLLTDDVADSTKRLPIPGLDQAARGFSRTVTAFSRIVVRSKTAAAGVVAGIIGLAVVSTAVLAPQLDYLPTGNRNFIFGFVIPPAGYNLETISKIMRRVEDATRPLWATETGPESEPDGPPKIDSLFAVSLQGRAFIGARAVDEGRARELLPVLRALASQEPGTLAAVSQPSLFGRSVGGGRAIDVNISGPDLAAVYAVAQRTFRVLSEVMPSSAGHQTRPVPGLTLDAPEVRVVPNRVRLADNGLSARELGQSVDAFNDGLRIAEITVGGERIDLTLSGKTQEVDETQGIANLPVVTRQGRIVPVSSLADVVVTSGPTEIRRVERERSVTLRVTPADEMPLQAAIDLISNEVLPKLRAQDLPDGIQFTLAGSADKLSETWNELVVDLLLALVIVYLVMAVLFESFIYPLIIMLSVPVAAAGGLGGLAILNIFVNQPLDMLTMLGFVILIGIVVNNAILLVHQTLYNIRTGGMDADTAITRATQNRIRPIFMSTLTSVFGMLPLVLFPGAGSELYRGLGSVVLGGLALSAVLTLAIVPPMMSITVGLIERRRPPADEPRPVPAE